MMTIPTSATPKHMPTPINRTTSTARIASSRAAILIRLMAPNDTPNNTAVPGFFMVQQDYHTVRSPLRTGLVLALLARLAVIDPAQRLPFAAQWTRCPLHDRKHRALQETLRRSGRRHEFADCFRMRRLTGPIDLLVEGMGCVLNSGW